jgi:hypothetical protein
MKDKILFSKLSMCHAQDGRSGLRIQKEPQGKNANSGAIRPVPDRSYQNPIGTSQEIGSSIPDRKTTDGNPSKSQQNLPTVSKQIPS